MKNKKKASILKIQLSRIQDIISEKSIDEKRMIHSSMNPKFCTMDKLFCL